MELGADYYTCSGGKRGVRWYGVVIEITGKHIKIKEYKTAIQAIKASTKLRESETLMQSVGHNLNKAIEKFKKDRKYKRLSVPRKTELIREILKDSHYKRNGIHIDYKIGSKEGFFGIV